MTDQRIVRVRFAPSPTGPLHIGGVRTALYNYLFARQNGGVFILRIEDTDQTRYVQGAEDYIVESLDWLGMNPDEGPGLGGEHGPYRQSERKHIYGEHIQKLLDNGTAYYAFDTPVELEAMRERKKAEGEHSPKYDHTTRSEMRNSLTLNETEVNELLEDGTPFTVRLLVHAGQQVTFEDRVRGTITFDTSELDDKVLMKADGLPTYHFANVVDDHLMEISHVIRGEEWLSSTPHHVLMYQAFGWEDGMPEFAHLPLILKPTGKGKLSKRDGAKFGFPVFPLDWQDEQETVPGFRETGFLPGALINFLAFLGWNPGTEQEIFDEQGLIEAFDIERIIKSGARFDFDKAKWFNAQHIKLKTADELMALTGLSGETSQAVHSLYRDRVTLINEFADVVAAYEAGTLPSLQDPRFVEKKWDGEMRAKFSELSAQLAQQDWSDKEALSAGLKSFVQDNGLKFGDVFRLLRTALVGTDQGPDLVEMLSILGKEEALRRIGESLDIFDNVTQD